MYPLHREALWVCPHISPPEQVPTPSSPNSWPWSLSMDPTLACHCSNRISWPWLAGRGSVASPDHAGQASLTVSRVFSPSHVKPLSFPLPSSTSAGQQLWIVDWQRRGKGWQQPCESFSTKSMRAAFIPPFRLGDSSNSSALLFHSSGEFLCIWLSQTLLQRIYIWYWKCRSGLSQRPCGPVSCSWQRWNFVHFCAYRCINTR